jgi:hypothetical protein
VARAHGQTRSFQAAMVTRAEVTNPMDERTCPVCSHMNGKIFEVRHLVDNMEEELAAETKGAVKKAHPWMSVSKLKELSPRAGNVSAADSARLAREGIAQPPYHFRCRCVLDISVEAGSWEPL